MTLTESVQRFLSTKDVVILATLQPDGAPLAMPMWFLHDPAAITMISVANLQKVRNLRRDGRVCIAAETGTLGVTIQGTATFLSDTPERRALAGAFVELLPAAAVLELLADRAGGRLVGAARHRAVGAGVEVGDPLEHGKLGAQVVHGRGY